MSRRKSLKSLGDWIGAGGHSFDGSLLRSAADDGAQQLDIDRLVAGRYQPRQRTDAKYLAELEQSVRQFGVIEPLVVRPLADGSHEWAGLTQEVFGHWAVRRPAGPRPARARR